MTFQFRAPVLDGALCHEGTQEQIDRMFDPALAESGEGPTPACLRVDIYVGEADMMTLIRSNVDLYVRIPGEDAVERLPVREMSSQMKAVYANALCAINEDDNITMLLEGVMAKWSGTSFVKAMEGRYLSVLFFGNGVGAIIQEYIPSWLDSGRNGVGKYFGTDAPALTRGEIMSVCLSDKDQSHHRALALVKHLEDVGPQMSAMFRHHCDHEVDAQLAPIDIADRI